MLHHCSINLTTKLLAQRRYWSTKIVGMILLLMFNTGCSHLKAPDIDLKIQVKPAGNPGVYIVTGSTNLPAESQIAIAAIRFFDSDKRVLPETTNNVNYSILAREIVKVKKGNLQTKLNLWQVAPDGRFQEVWQLHPSELGIALNPAPEVSFVAILAPAENSQKFSEKLAKEGKKLGGSLLRFTEDGQWYIKASQILSVALPEGKTTPPIVRLQDRNGGWGDRFMLKPKTENPIQISLPAIKTIQTNAPLSSSEFMR